MIKINIYSLTTCVALTSCVIMAVYTRGYSMGHKDCIRACQIGDEVLTNYYQEKYIENNH